MKSTTPFFVTLALAALLGTEAACSSNTTSPSGAAVSAVAVSPNPCAVGRTDSQQMQALATFADGTKQDVTDSSSTTWTSGNTSTATVDSSGKLVGVSAGITGITATFGGASNTVSCAVGP